MLKKDQKAPTTEESVEETAKRLIIRDSIIEKLSPSVYSIVCVGSLAYGKNIAVRKESDIDLLILMEPRDAERTYGCGLFTQNEWNSFAIQTFRDQKVEHISLIEYIDDVEIQYHFWNKEAQFSASQLELDSVKRLTSSGKDSSLTHLDFWGEQRHEQRLCTPYEKGFIQEYPVFRMIDNHFVPYEPVSNLLMSPDILHANDDQLRKNIENLWHKVAKQLSSEVSGSINLEKTSILNALPSNWNFPDTVRESIQERTKAELKLLNREAE